MYLNTQNPELFRAWAHEVREIKDLFYSRKYKRCAARCEELQISAVHPIHKSFLNFYQALSYESLGIVAHVYSNNKLPWLNLAKDHFNLALQVLPEPCGYEERDSVAATESPIGYSPAYVTLDVMKRYEHSSPADVNKTNCPSRNGFDDDHISNGECQNKTSPRSTRHSSSSADSAIPTSNHVPDFDAYPPRQDWVLESIPTMTKTPLKVTSKIPIFMNADTNTTPTTARSLNTIATHKTRLSQSLSSDHCLADDLVPTPLFRRPRKQDSEFSYLQTPSKVQLQSKPNDKVSTRLLPSDENSSFTVQLPISLPLQENRPIHEKPLPPLPFNHKPKFTRQGTRHVLVPTQPRVNVPSPSPRKSAIQTLVAKFEGKIQISSTPKFYGEMLAFGYLPKTPITPRFNQIRKTFAIHEDEGQDGDRDDNENKNTNDESESSKSTGIDGDGTDDEEEDSENTSAIQNRATDAVRDRPIVKGLTRTTSGLLPVTPTLSKPLNRHKKQEPLPTRLLVSNSNPATNLATPKSPTWKNTHTTTHPTRDNVFITPKSTQTPNPSSSSSTYSSTSTSSLTQPLQSFHTSLKTHLTQISTTISHVETAQESRRERQRQNLNLTDSGSGNGSGNGMGGMGRSVSFWSFEPVVKSGVGGSGTRSTSVRTSGPMSGPGRSGLRLGLRLGTGDGAGGDKRRTPGAGQVERGRERLGVRVY